MDPYYCIVDTAENEVADLCVLDAADDAEARHRARAAAENVPGWTQARVYAGERLVGCLERPAPAPLPLAA